MTPQSDPWMRAGHEPEEGLKRSSVVQEAALLDASSKPMDPLQPMQVTYHHGRGVRHRDVVETRIVKSHPTQARPA